jgi:hypothetical protein
LVILNAVKPNKATTPVQIPIFCVVERAILIALIVQFLSQEIFKDVNKLFEVINYAVSKNSFKIFINTPNFNENKT